MTRMRLATAEDDATVRSLLRENAMPGWVALTMEREPSFFAGHPGLGTEWAVLAEKDGEAFGLYTAAVRPSHVNGRAEMLGYLGGLRVDHRHRRRLRPLQAGYASIPQLAPRTATLPWWFTTIADGNRTARRLLEAGLPGLPAYVKRGEYVTFVLPASRGRRRGTWRAARPGEAAAIAHFHNVEAARYQCSPVLTPDLVERIGLDNFRVWEGGGRTHGVVALWNQLAFKQVVVRGYSRPIGVARHAYNLYARIFRRCALPAPGEPMRQTFLAFLALEQRPPVNSADIADLLSHCPTPLAVVGLHAGNRLADALSALKPIRYASNVYTVSFDAPVSLDGRAVQPEAALL